MEVKERRSSAKTNETLQIIYSRRSVRHYSKKDVELELIEQILDAGRMAPSAINMQPWKFYILTNKEVIRIFEKQTAISAAKGMWRSGLMNIIKSVSRSFTISHGIDFLKTKSPIFHAAPVVVFISAPKDNEWAALDIGMCSQNMMLAAKSIGLDSCPIGLGKYVQQTDVFLRLGVPKNDQILLAIVFGYSDETPVVHKRIKDNAFFLQ